MVTTNMEVSFVFNDICYWTHDARSFTTWSSAQRLCEQDGGKIALVEDEAVNMNISSKLVR